LTKERAVLAADTRYQAVDIIVLLVVLVAFIGAWIWLLIMLVRNKNFFSEDRARRIVVKVLLVVFTVFVPLLGVPVLFVIWCWTRPRRDLVLDEATRRDAG
jgi:hypothetical protein